MVLARTVKLKAADVVPLSASFLTKFRQCEWEERRVLGEALALLVLVAPIIRYCPLKWVGRIAAAGPFRKSSKSEEETKALTNMIGWAINRAAKRSPFRSLCFEQGLTAQIMLRRRGIDSTLLYGVALVPNASKGIRAHVWIETDLQPVIGQPAAGDFALLATWPEGRQQIWTED